MRVPVDLGPFLENVGLFGRIIETLAGFLQEEELVLTQKKEHIG
jgi:hypothetical protein